MAQVLVRGLKADVVAGLKSRAKRHGRSLQTELKDILVTASRHNAVEARALADRIRGTLAGRVHSESVELLAEDRLR
jgi:antitoxin FitA